MTEQPKQIDQGIVAARYELRRACKDAGSMGGLDARFWSRAELLATADRIKAATDKLFPVEGGE